MDFAVPEHSSRKHFKQGEKIIIEGDVGDGYLLRVIHVVVQNSNTTI